MSPVVVDSAELGRLLDEARGAIIFLKQALDDDWCPDCGWDWGRRPESCVTCRAVLTALSLANARESIRQDFEL